MKVAFHTLGCKLNFAETSTIRRVAEDKGYDIVPFENIADVYVINTCTVTEKTDKKCRNAIRRAIRMNPRGKVVVTGCFAELKPEEIEEIEGVSLIIGNNEKAKFAEYLSTINNNAPFENVYQDKPLKPEFFHAYSMGDRTRSFLKVQDGCNYFCSYCTIPYARGRSRNAPVSELVNEANDIARNGILEIVLTGINIGDFGHSTGENFYKLLQALEAVKKIKRYRISSIEPDLLSLEILKFVAGSEKLMPHFHIPLQSGSDTILKKMNRKYDTLLFQNKVKEILSLISGAGIGTDVIVGFPGEGEKEFRETFQFLQQLDIAYLHVFSYSERENTSSVKLADKVKEQVKNERSKILHDLSDYKKEVFYRNFIGSEKKVLFESKGKGNKMQGFTENYIKVETPLQKKYFNNIIPVSLIDFDKDNMSLIGRITE